MVWIFWKLIETKQELMSVCVFLIYNSCLTTTNNWFTIRLKEPIWQIETLRLRQRRSFCSPLLSCRYLRLRVFLSCRALFLDHSIFDDIKYTLKYRLILILLGYFNAMIFAIFNFIENTLFERLVLFFSPLWKWRFFRLK